MADAVRVTIYHTNKEYSEMCDEPRSNTHNIMKP